MGKQIMIIFVVLAIFVAFIIFNKKFQYICKESFNKQIPFNIWLYWENKPGVKKPAYIQMCQESVITNTGHNVKVIILNKNNITKYLPNLRKDLDRLALPQKADYIRLAILKTYGGMWLDSDIIVYKSLKPLFSNLKFYDYIGFGCHSRKCEANTKGTNKPANWAMISRKNGILVSKCFDRANQILDKNLDFSRSYNYHKLGRELIWSQITKLKLLTHGQWTYYHHDSKGIERDHNGQKYTNKRFLSKHETISSDFDSIFIPLYNTAPGFPQWFREMSRHDILQGQMLVSHLFRKALENK